MSFSLQAVPLTGHMVDLAAVDAATISRARAAAAAKMNEARQERSEAGGKSLPKKIATKCATLVTEAAKKVARSVKDRKKKDARYVGLTRAGSSEETLLGSADGTR